MAAAYEGEVGYTTRKRQRDAPREAKWVALPAALWAVSIGWLGAPDYAAARRAAKALCAAGRARPAHPRFLEMPPGAADVGRWIAGAATVMPCTVRADAHSLNAAQIRALFPTHTRLRSFRVKARHADLWSLNGLNRLTSLRIEVVPPAVIIDPLPADAPVWAREWPLAVPLRRMPALRSLSVVSDRSRECARSVTNAASKLYQLGELTVDPFPLRWVHHLCSWLTLNLHELYVVCPRSVLPSVLHGMVGLRVLDLDVATEVDRHAPFAPLTLPELRFLRARWRDNAFAACRHDCRILADGVSAPSLMRVVLGCHPVYAERGELYAFDHDRPDSPRGGLDSTALRATFEAMITSTTDI